jgi:hypothetical protein
MCLCRKCLGVVSCVDQDDDPRGTGNEEDVRIDGRPVV